MTRGARYIPLFIDLESEYDVPAQFLYALAGRESRWKPRKVASIKGEATPAEVRGHAVGLFQLTRKVVAGYNAAHATSYRKRDMLDGPRNARVAAWQLGRRVIPRFSADWTSARDIAILTQAWNSGPGGARRVLDSLPVTATVDDIKAAAQRIVARGDEFSGLAAKAYRYLASRKTKWAKATARDTLKAFADPSFTKPRAARWPGLIYSWLRRLWPFHF